MVDLDAPQASVSTGYMFACVKFWVSYGPEIFGALIHNIISAYLTCLVVFIHCFFQALMPMLSTQHWSRTHHCRTIQGMWRQFAIPRASSKCYTRSLTRLRMAGESLITLTLNTFCRVPIRVPGSGLYSAGVQKRWSSIRLMSYPLCMTGTGFMINTPRL